MMGGGSLCCGLCVVENGNETKTKTSHEGLMRDVGNLNVSCFMTLESRDARGSGYERYARRGRGPILIRNANEPSTPTQPATPRSANDTKTV